MCLCRFGSRELINLSQVLWLRTVNTNGSKCQSSARWWVQGTKDCKASGKREFLSNKTGCPLIFEVRRMWQTIRCRAKDKNNCWSMKIGRWEDDGWNHSKWVEENVIRASGELIVSKYVAESITMIAGRFGHEGLCQLRTELKKLQWELGYIANTPVYFCSGVLFFRAEADRSGVRNPL